MGKKKKVTLVKTKKDGSVKFKKDGGAKSKQVSVKKAEKKEKKGKGFVAKGNDAYVLGIPPSQMSGSAYDNKMAYNKNLKPSARLHYLENERHDKTSGSPMSKHMGGRKGK